MPFSDDATICVTHDDHLVTEGTDSSPYNTEKATSMPPNTATATVINNEPESIPIFTVSQGTDSVIVTMDATYCSDCTCQQGMKGVMQTVCWIL